MRKNIPSIVLCCVAFVLGATIGPGMLESATAMQRDDKQPKAFLSGSARSEKVLKQIHATLMETDKKIAAIEELVRKSVDNNAGKRKN
jgi:hypothetical protein